ncbi:hypothetical protein MMC07_002387 [Pseudocyphellaria aurata]|nr:hypothetical protein [Pseudocyphellaria aurata]
MSNQQAGKVEFAEHSKELREFQERQQKLVLPCDPRGNAGSSQQSQEEQARKNLAWHACEAEKSYKSTESATKK